MEMENLALLYTGIVTKKRIKAIHRNNYFFPHTCVCVALDTSCSSFVPSQYMYIYIYIYICLRVYKQR
jgi:hypothetical protein